MKVLGIDPGYDRLGIAVVDDATRPPRLLHSACVSPPAGEFADRLLAVGDAVAAAIAEHAPDAVAIEEVFLGKNRKTSTRVSEVRGAALYVARRAGVPVAEYAPARVKSAITGYGAADKRAIARIVPKLVSCERALAQDDELDAVAVAITHLAYASRAGYPHSG